MIMADKIIEQRKKSGWSQEELAQRLGVSRQSVSKWEGAQSMPDLNKVIAMADLFGVTTDYMLKDEIESPTSSSMDGSTDKTLDEPVRRVSMEEANEFLSVTRQASGQISLGVMLCVLSPIFVIMITLAAIAQKIRLTETQGGVLGVVAMMLLIGAAVALFIKHGMRLSKFDYLSKENIDTEYGVSGMVKQRKQEYESTRNFCLTAGILLCVLSVIPILVCVFFSESSDLLHGAGASAMLVLIAAGVYLIVRVSLVWSSFQKLLEEGDYSRKTKTAKNGLLSGIYWPVVTAAYLAYSFLTGDWGRSWIVWPVAGVLYAVIYRVEQAMQDRETR